MTTLAFAAILIALFALIIMISRIESNPKLAVNLFIALAFGIVAGLGIQSKNDSCTSSEKITKSENISLINYEPIQTLFINDVTALVDTKEFVGKVYNNYIKEGKGNKILYTFTPNKITGGSTLYEDSS